MKRNTGVFFGLQLNLKWNEEKQKHRESNQIQTNEQTFEMNLVFFFFIYLFRKRILNSERYWHTIENRTINGESFIR